MKYFAHIALLAFFASCGFTGEATFSGRRVPEVAPFADQGELIICEGRVRLAAPLRSTGGLCAAPGRACGADEDCASRERCLCGVCAVELCDGPEQCAPGWICVESAKRCDRPCRQDSECRPGESCSSGGCRGICEDSSDCQGGERCNTNLRLCVTDPCSDDSSCACNLQRVPATLSEPHAALEGSTILLWFERAGEIWRATGRDGRRFAIDPPRALLRGRSPSLVKLNDGWMIAFSDGKDLFTSFAANGIDFEPPGLSMTDATSPSLAGSRDALILHFVRGGAIWRALAVFGSPLWDQPVQVLAPGDVMVPPLWDAIDFVGSPFGEVFADQGGAVFVRLWFAARGVETPPQINFGTIVGTPPNFSIGVATSPVDGFYTVYPFNPVFDRAVNFVDHPSELEPSLLRTRDAWLLYYRRQRVDGTPEALAVARTPVEPLR